MKIDTLQIDTQHKKKNQHHKSTFYKQTSDKNITTQDELIFHKKTLDNNKTST